MIVGLLLPLLEFENLWETFVATLTVNELFTKRIKSAGISSCQNVNGQQQKLDDETVSLIRPHFFSYSQTDKGSGAQQKFPLALCTKNREWKQPDRRSNRERTQKMYGICLGWSEQAYWIS